MACRVAGVLQLQRTSAIFANGFPLYAEMTMAGLIRVIGWCGAFVLFVAACDGPERQAAVAPAIQPPLAAQSAIPDVRAGTVGLDTIRVDTVYVLADTADVSEQLQAAAKETARDVGRLSLRVLLALLVMIGAFWLVKLAVKALEVLAERSATRRLFFKKLVPSVRLLIWSAAIYYVVAGVFRISAQDLLLAAAAIGVAIGFAAQDILKNIFGGIIIVFDQPFQVGDKVSVGGTYGEVVSIGLRSTRLVTPDDNLVSVPNAQVVDGQVANANAGALDCQVVVDLYLPGWTDVMRAKAIAYSAAANSRYVFLDKPIVVNVKDEFKETFLTHLKVKAYVIDTRYEFAFASDVTETAKTEFLREGLLYPFAKPDLYSNPEHGSAPPNGQSSADQPST